MGAVAGLLKRLEAGPKALCIALCLAIVAVVGWADYLTGYNLFFFIFYLVAVFLAVWFVGTRTGTLISLVSVTAWVSSDIAAGKRYPDYFTPFWNALIMFIFYQVVVALLGRLRILQRDLEDRVRHRTADLTREMQERVRLQKELLEATEREQQRIGHDLHDSLCQHLTGTALAGHALSRKLADRSLAEARDADRVVELVEGAIELTRKLARGLHPMDIQSGQLADGLAELASQIRERFRISCRLQCDTFPGQLDTQAIAHLYRIAQEAATNAVRHGKAERIDIRLENAGDGMILTITDNGSGLPENARQGQGMGLRIMACRADAIGATFQVERLAEGGTRVACRLPAPADAKQ